MFDIKNVYQAHSVRDALTLLEEHPGAVFVAGGTDVMVRVRQRALQHAELICIASIPELCGIHCEQDGTLVIGPTTPFAEIASNSLIKRLVPLLGYAATQVGSPQIRHVATLGGNLCNGAVSADGALPLVALDAELELTSREGKRTISATDFHCGPSKTVLHSDKELLTAIRVSPENYEGWGGCYLKFGQRNAMEIATLNCAATVRLAEDATRIATLRIAFGVAAPVPTRCSALEETVRGMPIDEQLYRVIPEKALEELTPRDSWRASRAFRQQLIRTQSVRAVKQAIEQAKGMKYV